MPPQFQFPTLILTDAAAFTDQLCQIHYGVPADDCLLPGEQIVDQRETSSNDGPHNGFLPEGPGFLGYHAQIADSSYNSFIAPQANMPSPIAGPVDSTGGDIPATNSDLSWGHPEHSYFSDGVSAIVNPSSLPGLTSTSDSRQPPPGFSAGAPQNPISSQESADDRWPCGWRGKHGGTCNVLIGYRCEAHLASAHGIVNMSRTQIVECGHCGKHLRRQSILRHYREKHLGFHR
ncbi:hypothetical protein F5141DRAFT_81100 [Pisolithus sp. B1]|nr:hypothetical protein F5141DRAFT_81100 [Pisolithus sp. B1]